MKLFTCCPIPLEAEDYLHRDQLLKKKMEILSTKFPNENKGFRASERWLHRKKTFYGICQLNVNSEKLPEDEVEAALCVL